MLSIAANASMCAPGWFRGQLCLGCVAPVDVYSLKTGPNPGSSIFRGFSTSNYKLTDIVGPPQY